MDKIPWSIGFYHPEFQRLGFPTGFCPVFPRGTEVGSEATVGAAENFLIHDKLRELALFADYMDGASPLSLGYFDFTQEGQPFSGGGATPAAEETPACEGEAPAETPAEPEAPADDEENGYNIRFQLLPDRSLKAIVPSQGKIYNLNVTPLRVKPEENPFSGVH